MADASLLEHVTERLEADDDPRLVAFARILLRRIPPGFATDPDELAARTRSLFAFVAERKAPAAVRAFNPDPDEHGYDAPGTVVEVNQADSPFLLDSVTNELEAYGLNVRGVLHPVVGVEREEGSLVAVSHPRDAVLRESVQHYQLDRRAFDADLPGIEQTVREVLEAVAEVVADFQALRQATRRMAELLDEARPHSSEAVVDEGIAFLRWLADDNFVFLGYREYRVAAGDDGPAVQAVPDSGLGLLRDVRRSSMVDPVPLADLPDEVAERYRSGEVLTITKTNAVSPVHRAAKMDYVGVRILGADGTTAGEARLLGLFTSKAYMEPAARTPILRRKLDEIVEAEDLIEGTHDHKALVALFEGFSKHDLLAADTAELHQTLAGMLAVQEREQVRVFVRRDLLERNVSVLITMPRDHFTAGLRRRLQDLVMERFGGRSVDYHLNLGEAESAQIHFTVWVEGAVPEVDYASLEAEVRDMARSWTEQLVEVLTGVMPRGDARTVAERWTPHLPEYYRSSTSLTIAAGDVLRLSELESGDRRFVVGIQNEQAGGHDRLTRIALYRDDGKRPLSDLLPALEDLGLAVVEEVPTRLEEMTDHVIHDFGVLDATGSPLDPARFGLVAQALTEVWGGGAATDDLDRLVVAAGLRRSQVDVLRAYRTYWRRVAPVFTVGYVNDTLVDHADVAADLVRLFEARFDPDRRDEDAADALATDLGARLDAIPSIEQDRILRSFLRLIEATLRTNAFVPRRNALAFKFRSAAVPDAPSPHPMAEIFVIGRDVEGIHLRGGMVARGGLRWSTRREDYRTEVLGLMKAQMTKNAVIVPTGAKGGFVLLHPPEDPALLREAVASGYRTFVDGLLDLTDDRRAGRVVHPEGVVVRDGPDPYLVVAADKGTASFSDLANGIAADRGFWLGDAFASGGSGGYDHKALGITARGAWESLRQHFLELGLDPSTDPFTVVGIGDMSGDVFGNGMLLSDRIRLVAAFDHRHVFLDPDPDPSASHAERARLFALPRSSWADYDPGLLSAGGGVHDRSSKRIDLSPQVRALLDTDRDAATPDEVISMILRAPVDVIWNGGIGTYVKASAETDAEAGDRVNDPVRVDGRDVAARVVIEGGNLGLTQAGRVEFALSGGRVNTDFIDNSGGVDCSDREVNLKILLDLAIADGTIDGEERRRVVADAADDVVSRILAANAAQARVLAREERVAPLRMASYEELMDLLEEAGLLDRAIEGLPGSEAMVERGREGRGLTRPELAVLLAYAKRWLRAALVASPLSESTELMGDVARYFPAAVVERFGDLLDRHPLRRELAATIAANSVVDDQGIVFVSRMSVRTGASPAAVVSAYRIARDVADAGTRRAELEAIGDLDLWARASGRLYDTVSALSRWYVRHAPDASVAERVAVDRPGFEALERALVADPGLWRERDRSLRDRLVEAGAPEELADHQAVLPLLASAPDLVEVAAGHGVEPTDVLPVFLEAGRVFALDRLGTLAASAPIRSSWDRWALWATEEDLLALRRRATERVVEAAGVGAGAIDRFLAASPATMARIEAFLKRLDASDPDVAAVTVAVRQVGAAIG
ncbi:MAG: NAD-glutamate dehydrogenase [Acidimicrobiia bacterium]|nr:NAD-glutamate dehydrogenase [Acidimicrobiia bacterium]